jgi:hypothetical protein
MACGSFVYLVGVAVLSQATIDWYLVTARGGSQPRQSPYVVVPPTVVAVRQINAAPLSRRNVPPLSARA